MNALDDASDGPILTIRTDADAERYMALVRASAARVQVWLSSQSADPLELLKRMKFEPVGVHPIEARPLNIVEQINQTWTYGVAIAAARELLRLHPEASGFRLAPGAAAKLPLDIMSVESGLVGAETFAAVKPTNNNKLATDLLKLSLRPELHRYVFFMSPAYPMTQRQLALEKHGVQIWSVTV